MKNVNYMSGFANAISQFKVAFEQNYVRITPKFYRLGISHIYWVNQEE